MMDFTKAKLLLDVFHATLNLPQLKAINDAALKELVAIATPTVASTGSSTSTSTVEKKI